MVGVLGALPVLLGGSRCCRDNLDGWIGACWAPLFTLLGSTRFAPNATLGGRMSGAAVIVAGSIASDALGAILYSIVAGIFGFSGLAYMIAMSVGMLLSLIPVTVLRAWSDVADVTRTFGTLMSFLLPGMVLTTDVRVRSLFGAGTDATSGSYIISWDSTRDVVTEAWKVAAWRMLSGLWAAAVIVSVSMFLFPLLSSEALVRNIDRFMLRSLDSKMGTLLSTLLDESEEGPSKIHEDGQHGREDTEAKSASIHGGTDMFIPSASPSLSEPRSIGDNPGVTAREKNKSNRKPHWQLAPTFGGAQEFLESRNTSSLGGGGGGGIVSSTSKELLHGEDSLMHPTEQLLSGGILHQRRSSMDTAIDRSKKDLARTSNSVYRQHGGNDPNGHDKEDLSDEEDEVDGGWIGAIPQRRAKWLGMQPVTLARDSDGRACLLDSETFCSSLAWEPAAYTKGAPELWQNVINILHSLLYTMQCLQLCIDGANGRRYSRKTLCQLLTPEARDLHREFCALLVAHLERCRRMLPLMALKLPLVEVRPGQPPRTCRFSKRIEDEDFEVFEVLETLLPPDQHPGAAPDGVLGATHEAFPRLPKQRQHAVAYLRRSLFMYFETLYGAQSNLYASRAGEMRVLHYLLVMIHSIYSDLERLDAAVDAFGIEQEMYVIVRRQTSPPSHQRSTGVRNREREQTHSANFSHNTFHLDCGLLFRWLATRATLVQQAWRRFFRRATMWEYLVTVYKAVKKFRAGAQSDMSRAQTLDDLKYGIKLWVALWVAWVLCFWLQPLEAFQSYNLNWMQTAVAIVFLPEVDASWSLSVLRLAGTVLGGVAAYLVMLNHTVATSALLVGLLSFWISGVCGYCFYVVAPSKQYGYMLFLLTYVIVVFCQFDGLSAGTFSFALQRTVLNVIGILFALGVNSVAWPRFATDTVRQDIVCASLASLKWALAGYRLIRGAAQEAAVRTASGVGESRLQTSAGFVDMSSMPNLSDIQKMLDDSQTTMQKDLSAISSSLLRVSIAAYQMFVSLQGMRTCLLRSPVVTGQYQGSDYVAYWQHMESEQELCMMVAEKVLLATESVLNTLVYSSAPVFFRRLALGWDFDDAISDSVIELELALAELEMSREKFRERFLARRKELMAPILSGRSTVAEHIRVFQSDDFLRFNSFFFAYVTFLNKPTLTGVTVAVDAQASLTRIRETRFW
ncbi:hypothetical protein FVE85_3120 [Porphyridium purpureum]|uniref:DUF2421 domain-containing protein n=1 Tax=Porphyridium purpureum TaxID=35688 RepID=A0A5J4YTP9_PORPP|nr:hypothetical protein FVE85_3120 [Porphyridium purpureum]|eukprot:POR6720..scf227_4